MNKNTVKGVQFEQPLFEFSGACAGCGETPYAKLVTQLVGDRMMIANATGCSSIWGASAPSMPYCKNAAGHGPSWANSLFEDNAEYGLGMYLGVKHTRERVADRVKEALNLPVSEELKAAMQNWLDNMNVSDGTRERAEALKAYLTANEKVPANLYKVSFGGENWDGLIKALETSSMKDKETFIHIIKNTGDDALRKKEIMHVGGGAPYRTMLKEIYPGLRKVNCKIDYTVVNFDVEQGRIVIKTNPKYLSLNEMYQVANSYPKGSDDFVNVFDIAVRIYPDDEVANLNAAAVALTKKDLKTAVKFMEKANKQTAEYINNSGVYDFLNGNINQSIAAFTQAAHMGNDAAKANLKQLQKILDSKKPSGK